MGVINDFHVDPQAMRSNFIYSRYSKGEARQENHMTVHPEKSPFLLCWSRSARIFVFMACRMALSNTFLTPFPVLAEHS